MTAGGNLRNPEKIADRGQYGAIRDQNGTYWVVEDRMYGIQEGKMVTSVDTPWDAYTLRIANGRMYVIGPNAVYMKQLS